MPICVFCGKREVTKEHLFAKWIRDEYADQRASGPSSIGLQRDDETVWAYSGDALDQGVNDFCAGCNNGWMSELEAKAARVVKPMIRGKVSDGGILLSITEQANVASWATKTAFVLQRLHPTENRIPEAYYRDFRRTQQPSSDVFVMMGARQTAGDENGLNVFEYLCRFVGAESAGIQHIHFVIGFVYFGVAIFIGRPRRLPKDIHAPAWGRCNLIWPVHSGEAGWPTPPIDDVGGVHGMFDACCAANWS